MTECQGCGAWNERHRALCVLCGAPLAEVDEWDADAEPLPLPPLPDGGLRASMPAWLRDLPAEPALAAIPETELTPENALTPSPSPSPDEPSPQPLSLCEGRGAPGGDVRGEPGPSGEVAPVRPDAIGWLPSPSPEGEGLGVRVSSSDPSLGPTADPRTFLRDEDFPRWLRELPALPPRPPRPPRPEPAVMAVAEPAPIPEPVIEFAAPAPEPALPAVEPAPAAPVPPVAAAALPASIATAPRRPAWEQALLALLGLAIVVAIVWALIANGLIGGA